MKIWIAVRFAFTALGPLLAGCATMPEPQVGLSNAPSLNRRWGRGDLGHDVIANGSDSCERHWSKEPDPVPHRTVACAIGEPVSPAGSTPMMAVRANSKIEIREVQHEP